MPDTDPRNLPTDHPLRSRKLPWYNESICGEITPQTVQLFEEYSNIPASELESHIYKFVILGWPVTT